MPQTSFALMTNVGRAKEAAALANASTIQITHIAIGDGATVPSGGETALYHEVTRKTISGHGTVVGADNVAYFDCYLAAADGPYTIREAGLYDVVGDLIAIAHYDPPINKPVPSSGQTVEGSVRLEVAFSNVATIFIVVDPTVQVALQRLTRLPWLPIIELYRNAPPASPVPGDVYVVGPVPTGSWGGNAGKVTEYTLAGWAMIAPPAGHGVSLPNGRVYELVGGVYVEKIALDVQSGKWLFGADIGTTNNIIVTLNPVPAALVAGMEIRVKMANTITGASVLNASGLGNKAVIHPDGSPCTARDAVAGAIASFVYDGVSWQLQGTQPGVLTASRNYYVNPDTGSDTVNDGLSVAAPFKTVQKALITIAAFNMNGYSASINCANSANYAPFTSVPLNGSGQVLIIGNLASPASCVIHSATTNYTATGACAYFSHPGYIFAGFTFLSDNLTSVAVVPSGFGIRAGAGASIILYNHSFGTCYGPHLSAENAANVLVFGNQNAASVGTAVTWKIIGSASYHMISQSGASLSVPYGTDMVVGAAVTFDGAFVGSVQGWFYGFFNSITGASNVSGAKYAATLNGIINSNGSGASYFPGTITGTTSTGGQYV